MAFELKINFQFVGNKENPFITNALEILVYNEPLTHHYTTLFKKSQKCLNMAQLLSTSKIPKHFTKDSQKLMKNLSEYLSSQFNISAQGFE